MKLVTIIVAYGKNRVIGSKNKLPWHLPADLKHFKEITIGHSIVMGRKTYESIGRPLPDRQNIIVTRQKEPEILGCTIAGSVEDAVDKARPPLVFIIGGGEIFRQSLEIADVVLATEIEHEFEGDVLFPELSNQWTEIYRETFKPDDKNPYAYSFVTYNKTR